MTIEEIQRLQDQEFEELEKTIHQRNEKRAERNSNTRLQY
jgi:hypothetical protein